MDWPAAKALATAKGGPWEALRPIIEDCLRSAAASSPPRMSQPEDALGNEIASLACVLPALRGASDAAETQLAAVAQLCLDADMSPLRGEMALAQGLKLAILKGMTSDLNVADVRALLFGADRPPLRYWHARLLLVQALLAHAWHHPDRADELDARFAALESTESHPLVARGIALARQGLRDIRTPSNGRYPLSRYMWMHERDAVRWVEQGKSEIVQLAADAILLNNMTYRLRKSAAPRADEVAALSELPRCMRTCMDVVSLAKGCRCSQGLCDAPGEPAVAATRAQFSESFCREQARLPHGRGRRPGGGGASPCTARDGGWWSSGTCRQRSHMASIGLRVTRVQQLSQARCGGACLPARGAACRRLATRPPRSPERSALHQWRRRVEDETNGAVKGAADTASASSPGGPLLVRMVRRRRACNRQAAAMWRAAPRWPLAKGVVRCKTRSAPARRSTVGSTPKVASRQAGPVCLGVGTQQAGTGRWSAVRWSGVNIPYRASAARGTFLVRSKRSRRPLLIPTRRPGPARGGRCVARGAHIIDRAAGGVQEVPIDVALTGMYGHSSP